MPRPEMAQPREATLGDHPVPTSPWQQAWQDATPGEPERETEHEGRQTGAACGEVRGHAQQIESEHPQQT